MAYFDVYRPFVELLCTSHPTQQQEEILVQRESGFLGLVLGPLLEGLAELV
jgi:hypothetical protein